MKLRQLLLLTSTLLLLIVTNLDSAKASNREFFFEKEIIKKNIKHFQNEEVYVCNGSYSIAYHSRTNCRGLNNCKSSVTSVSESYAESVLKRRPCCICWKTDGGCRTDESDYLIRSLNIEPPNIEPPNKYNPYIQQNPVNAMVTVGMYLQKKYDTRKDWIQFRINGLVDLINTLFTQENLPNCTNCVFISIRENRAKDISDYAKKLAYADFSNDYTFSTIQNSFNTIESSIYSTYSFFLHNDAK